MKQIRQISIPNAKEIFKNKLNEVLGEEAVWLPEYDEIVDWLSDNKRKGLLLIGGVGVGKTIIGRDVMKLIFNDILHLNYITSTPFDMAKRKSEMNCSCPWFIDDIGLEPLNVEYGVKSEPFVEVVYNAEVNGQILVLTANMTGEMMSKRYGERTMDRLSSIVRLVVFHGESMRRKF